MNKSFFALIIGCFTGLSASQYDIKSAGEPISMYGAGPTACAQATVNAAADPVERAEGLIEQRLGILFPDWAISPDQKRMLKNFITLNTDFENSGNIFVEYPSTFLDYQSIEALHKFLLERNFPAQRIEADFISAHFVMNQRVALSDQIVMWFSENSDSRKGEHNPLLITLAYLMPHSSLLNIIDQALMYATTGQSLALATELLSYGANANTQDKNGWTPLIRVAAGKPLTRNVAEFDAWRMAEGLFVSSDDDYRRMNEAATEQRLSIIRRLFKHKANIHAKTDDGFTALHGACWHASKPIVRELLAAQPAPNVCATTSDGDTPMMLASKNMFATKARRKIVTLIARHYDANSIAPSPADAYIQSQRNRQKVEKEDAQKHDETVHNFARSTVLSSFARKHKQTNVFTVLRLREVGLNRPIKHTKNAATICRPPKKDAALICEPPISLS